MPDGYPIRNIHIEDAHRVMPGPVITRKMTPEEWEKYGPVNTKARRFGMRKKIDFENFLELAKKFGLDKKGRNQIAQELGMERIDVTKYIHRPDIKKKLKEAGLTLSEMPTENREAENETTPPEESTVESKKELLNNISKALLNMPLAQAVKEVCESNAPKEPHIEMHLNLCADLHEMYVAKNTAYGDSFSITFQEFGIISALTRMSDKWNRIKSLAQGAKNDVSDESLEDTLMDLANYCIMTVMELRRAKP